MLLERKDKFFYPTHGPRIPNPIDFTSALINHRISRENQILDCLRVASKTIPDLVTEMYVETPHILHMAAGQSVFSHLVHLVEKNLVKTDGPPSADGLFELAK